MLVGLYTHRNLYICTCTICCYVHTRMDAHCFGPGEYFIISHTRSCSLPHYIVLTCKYLSACTYSIGCTYISYYFVFQTIVLSSNGGGMSAWFGPGQTTFGMVYDIVYSMHSNPC